MKVIRRGGHISVDVRRIGVVSFGLMKVLGGLNEHFLSTEYPRGPQQCYLELRIQEKKEVLSPETEGDQVLLPIDGEVDVSYRSRDKGEMLVEADAIHRSCRNEDFR